MGKHIQAVLPDDLGRWVDDTLQHGQKGAFIVECFDNLRALMTEELSPTFGVCSPGNHHHGHEDGRERE
jgi:hypothetical protein